MNAMFNFLANPFEEGTTLGEQGSSIFDTGVYVIKTPEEGERYKYQQILRPATSEEADWYYSKMMPVQPTHEVGDPNYGEFHDGVWIPY